MKKFTRGFTLIELLVVIAIIGILSSIILVSLNAARSKAKEGRAQGEMAQIRTVLESNYNGSGYPDLAMIAVGNPAVKVATGYSTSLDTLISDIATQLGNPTGVTGNIPVDGAGKISSTYGGTGTATANNSGVVIYSYSGNAGAATIVDYAIYIKTSIGHNCVDSSGNTKVGVAGAPSYVPSTTGSPLVALCQ